MKLPSRQEQLDLVVVRGFGGELMLLRTNVTLERFIGASDFHYCALASGVATIFLPPRPLDPAAQTTTKPRRGQKMA